VKYALVEKKDHLAVHGIFESLDSANKHLEKTIPEYIKRNYFINKELKTPADFDIIPYNSLRVRILANGPKKQA
jgi:hypothetical protein